MGRKWPTGKEEKRLIALREQKGYTLDQIAQEAGVSVATAGFYLKGIYPLQKLIDELPSYPKEIIQIKGDCALTSDWHSPYFSMIWLKRLVEVSDKLGINQLAIVGDLTDMKWLGKYLVRDKRGGLNKDLEIIVSLLQLLLKRYDRVYWSQGNHEARLFGALREHDITPVLAKLIEESSNAGRLIVTSGSTMLLNDTWRLEHPKTYSTDATKVSTSISMIFHKNVACAHGHRIGFKRDVSGEYLAIDLGGMFDIDKQEYLHLGGVTTHPRWNPGFWIYKGKKLQCFDSAMVDWKSWGNGDEVQLTNNCISAPDASPE